MCDNQLQITIQQSNCIRHNNSGDLHICIMLFGVTTDVQDLLRASS